uniref:Uncharacterized protein n=1 Tax=Anopheles atroparvus TaxID=41427 RepID=A0A182ITU6_ANOAO
MKRQHSSDEPRTKGLRARGRQTDSPDCWIFSRPVVWWWWWCWWSTSHSLGFGDGVVEGASSSEEDSSLRYDCGVSGIGYICTSPDEDEAAEKGEMGGEAVVVAPGVLAGDWSTCTESGDTLSRSFRRWPRCVISFVPSLMSTPGVEARQRETSLAACVNPARKRSASMTGLAARRCWRRSLCRWRTVSSRMSAFSSLATFSPSDCSADTISSFSSSRQRLMRARRLRSSIGFITFRYCLPLPFVSRSPRSALAADLILWN